LGGLNGNGGNSEIRRALRPVSVFLIAITVVAAAMAVEGWRLPSFLLAEVIVLIGVLLAIHVYKTVRDLKRRSAVVNEAAGQAEKHYVGVLHRIVRFVEARDKYRRGHSDRVGRLAEQIARQLGLEQQRCELLNLAGQLHDIGLLAVSNRVLSKVTTIKADEFRGVMHHAHISYEVLKPLTMLEDVLPAILHHHERMNGTGYPSGLHGEAIPFEARILAVADAYEAMTHDRPNRPAMSPLNAMGELHRCTPAGYDETCVRALADIVHLPVLQQVQTASVEPEVVCV